MIRALMVHSEFRPQSSGVARHMDGLARALAAGGAVAPTILAPELEASVLRDVRLVKGGFGALMGEMSRCDVVHAHGARTLLSAAALRLARVMGKPAVFTPHCYYQGGGPVRRAVKQLWDLAVESGSLSRADAVILLHPGWRDEVTALGFHPRRVAVIPNCVDAEAVRSRLAAAEPTRLSGHPALLSVGRLDRIKRLDDVIGALAEPGLEQAHLHLAGRGEDGGRLRELAERLGLGGRVHILGWCDDGAAAAMMRGCDAMVLASEREGLPTVVLEALLAGVPIALSDIEGNRAVADAVGWPHLFPLGDRRALAECLLACAGATVGPAVPEAVARRFSWQSRAADVAALYADLLRPERGRA